MKKIFATLAIAGVAFGVIGTGVASADQPSRPGCFGRDRAAGVAYIKDVLGENWGHTYDDVNGPNDAASVRAGNNSTINAQYKALYCV